MINLNYIARFSLLLFLVNAPHFVQSKGQLEILNEETWQKLLDGEWMVEFFAPWCPACKTLNPVWSEFAKWSDDLNIHVAAIDVTDNPGLSGRFLITALPTILHVKDGTFRHYSGSRNKEGFLSFIEKKKWEEIPPVSYWKSPQSIPMEVVSNFFKLSMYLRTLHSYMMEQYGLPEWGSYIVFGLLTVMLGAFLGLIVVFVIDFLCPARRANPERAVMNEREGEFEEDLIADPEPDLIEDPEPEGEFEEDLIADPEPVADAPEPVANAPEPVADAQIPVENVKATGDSGIAEDDQAGSSGIRRRAVD